MSTMVIIAAAGILASIQAWLFWRERNRPSHRYMRAYEVLDPLRARDFRLPLEVSVDAFYSKIHEGAIFVTDSDPSYLGRHWSDPVPNEKCDTDLWKISERNNWSDRIKPYYFAHKGRYFVDLVLLDDFRQKNPSVRKRYGYRIVCTATVTSSSEKFRPGSVLKSSQGYSNPAIASAAGKKALAELQAARKGSNSYQQALGTARIDVHIYNEDIFGQPQALLKLIEEDADGPYGFRLVCTEEFSAFNERFEVGQILYEVAERPFPRKVDATNAAAKYVRQAHDERLGTAAHRRVLSTARTDLLPANPPAGRPLC